MKEAGEEGACGAQLSGVVTWLVLQIFECFFCAVLLLLSTSSFFRGGFRGRGGVPGWGGGFLCGDVYGCVVSRH